MATIFTTTIHDRKRTCFQAMVSLRRIEKYLLEDDVDESNVTYNQATGRRHD